MNRLKPCPVCRARFLPVNGQKTCSHARGKVHGGIMPERRIPKEPPSSEGEEG